MKIVYLCYAFAPNQGTEPTNAWKTVESMSKIGFSGYVITRDSNRAKISENDLHLIKNFTPIFVKIPVNLIREKSGAHYLIWQIICLFKVRKLINSQRINIVHHLTYGSLNAGTLIGFLNAIKVFGPIGGGQVMQDGQSKYFRNTYYKELFRKIRIRLIGNNIIYKMIYRRLDSIICTNQETEKIIRKMTGAHITFMLDSGIESSAIKEVNIRKSKNVVKLIWLGSLQEIKGVYLFEEVIKHIAVECEITVLGDGPLKKEMIRIVKTYNKENISLRYLGRIKWDEVFSIIEEHDFHIFTSLRDSFGSQILESAALGIPTICLNQSGVKTFMSESQVIGIEPEPSLSLAMRFAQRINEMATMDDTEYGEMSKNASNFAANYTWQSRADKLRSIYLSLDTEDQGARA